MTEEAGKKPARVIVVDDQTVVREGIVMLLGLLPGIEVVGAAGDGEEAVRLVAELAPDVVLMDLRMPRCDGVEATRRIRAEHPGTQVVVLTTFADDESLFPALKAGARGHLTQDAGGDGVVRGGGGVRPRGAGRGPAAISQRTREVTRSCGQCGACSPGTPDCRRASSVGCWSGCRTPSRRSRWPRRRPTGSPHGRSKCWR